MQIKVKHTDSISVVRLDGNFLSEADQDKFRKLVRKLVDQGKTHLVIDLTHVEHMNSCGLGSLVCAFTTVRRAGGELLLAGVGVFVEDVLKITRLDTVFHTFPSVEVAMSEFHVHSS